MQPTVMEARPPLVNFETRAEEDRASSIAAGNMVYKDVDYAIITPAGSKDRIERVVSEWLTMLAEQVKQGRFPMEWAAFYKRAYTSWKAEGQIPLEGSPLANWPVLSPGQVKSLAAINVQTIEQLAEANEETILRLGMGGRALKDRAVEWLRASGSDAGKQSAEIVDLRQKLELSEAQGLVMQQQLSVLQAQVAALVGNAGAAAAPADQSGGGQASFLDGLDGGGSDGLTPELRALQNNAPGALTGARPL